MPSEMQSIGLSESSENMARYLYRDALQGSSCALARRPAAAASSHVPIRTSRLSVDAMRTGLLPARSPRGPLGRRCECGRVTAVPLDMPTVLTSAGVSAVVAVHTAGMVARRKARADRDVAARQVVRDAVRPVQQEIRRCAMDGNSDRRPRVAVVDDAVVLSAVLRRCPTYLRGADG